jgi:hypothetical protein
MKFLYGTNLKGTSLTYQNANLWFATDKVKPALTYSIEDGIIAIAVANVKPIAEDYSWRNHRGIQSLLDLESGAIDFTINRNQDLDEVIVRQTPEPLQNGLNLNHISYDFYKVSSKRILHKFKRRPKIICRLP